MSLQPRGRLLPHHHGDEELDGEVDEEVQPGVETILLYMLMMNTPEGGWSPPEVDSGGVSPLRSSPAAAFCLAISGFVFPRRLFLENVGGLFL